MGIGEILELSNKFATNVMKITQQSSTEMHMMVELCRVKYARALAHVSIHLASRRMAVPQHINRAADNRMTVERRNPSHSVWKT